MRVARIAAVLDVVRISVARRPASLSQKSRTTSDRPCHSGGQYSTGVRSSRTTRPPGRRERITLSGSSYLAGEASTNRRSKGPWARRAGQSLCRTCTSEYFWKSAAADDALVSSISTVRNRLPPVRALVIHAAPTPHPVPTSPIVPARHPLARTRDAQPRASTSSQSPSGAPGPSLAQREVGPRFVTYTLS